jgi:serine/threonine protein kinase
VAMYELLAGFLKRPCPPAWRSNFADQPAVGALACYSRRRAPLRLDRSVHPLLLLAAQAHQQAGPREDARRRVRRSAGPAAPPPFPLTARPVSPRARLELASIAGAQDLLKQLLAIKPGERLSAADAMQHPWLQQAAPARASVERQGSMKERQQRASLSIAGFAQLSPPRMSKAAANGLP